MPVDVQILPAGVQAVPYDYLLDTSQEVVPKAIAATFDGTGAAGAFLPTLVILAPGGHEAARIPAASPIAAGASAEVTWFPDGEEPLASAPPGVATPDWAVATNRTLTVVQGSTTSTFPYTAFVAGNPAMFSLDGGIGTVNTNAPGLYEVQAYLLVFSGNAATLHLGLDQPLPTSAGDSNLQNAPGLYVNRTGTATAIPGVNQWELHWRSFYNIRSNLCKFGFRVIAQAAGGNWTGAIASLTVMRLQPAAAVDISI